MAEEHAIIDIGSNTVRLVVYGGPPRAPSVLHNEKVTAKLGKNVAESGKLGEKASALALAALARYAALLEMRGIADVTTVATAAVREAANGGAFLARVAALGLRPRLLSGVEEALAGAQGVIAAFPGAQGAVADLGGGSLELSAVGQGRAHHGTSLPLGTLRLATLREGGAAKFGRKIHRFIAQAPLADTSGTPLYLVGGSCRALALLIMRRLAWPVDDPHGFALPGDAALASFRSLARGLAGDRLSEGAGGISAARLAAIPDAAALMAVVVRDLRPSEVVFSSWGLREGLLQSSHADEVRAQDPLLAGVGAFAQSLGISAQLSAIVAGWTASLSAGERLVPERLRLAGTLLALASMRIEPNLRAQDCLDWALRKRWVGVDAPGRAVMAMTALANTGRTEVPAALGALASSEVLKVAAGWGLAIRLCRKVTGLALPALSDTVLVNNGPMLQLKLSGYASVLCTDAVEKDLRNLARWLGCEPQVVVLSG